MKFVSAVNPANLYNLYGKIWQDVAYHANGTFSLNLHTNDLVLYAHFRGINNWLPRHHFHVNPTRLTQFDDSNAQKAERETSQILIEQLLMGYWFIWNGVNFVGEHILNMSLWYNHRGLITIRKRSLCVITLPLYVWRCYIDYSGMLVSITATLVPRRTIHWQWTRRAWQTFLRIKTPRPTVL